MILIVGNKHDDILYFRSVMINRREETLFDNYQISVGTIFNQAVALLYDVHTPSVASALTLHIIQKYGINLVFALGRAVSVSGKLKTGDIVMCPRVGFGDVDLTLEVPVRLGQAPNFPFLFQSQNDVIDFTTKALDRRIQGNYYRATLITSSSLYQRKEDLLGISNNGTPYGIEGNVVADTISGGICLACHMAHVAFAVLKVVEREVTETNDIKRYAKVLGRYSELGRAVVTCIGDIGSNTVLHSGGSES